MKHSIKITTCSDVALEIQVSETIITDAEGTHNAGKELALILTDESGETKKEMSATLSADNARILAYSLRRMAKGL